MDQNPYAAPGTKVSDIERESGLGLPAGTLLYSPGQIFAASFIGSPLAAGWFFSRNYRAFGKDRSAGQALWLGLAATALVFAIAFVLPEKFPNIALPLGYSYGIYYYAKSIFGPSFGKHVASGGSKGSSWVVAGVSILCLAAAMAAVFGVVFAWLMLTGQY